MFKYKCLARDYSPCYGVRELLFGTARHVIAVGLFIWIILGQHFSGYRSSALILVISAVLYYFIYIMLYMIVAFGLLSILVKLGQTVTGDLYQQQIIRLSRALRKKRPEYETRQHKVILLHDNAQLHVTKAVKKTLKTLW